jgi:hypothetical protein
MVTTSPPTGNRFAAEIRLPDALEKSSSVLSTIWRCDPIALNGDQFWRNGKYDAAALENVYVMDYARARQRVDAISRHSSLRAGPEYRRGSVSVSPLNMPSSWRSNHHRAIRRLCFWVDDQR